jgi:hypothetical protein
VACLQFYRSPIPTPTQKCTFLWPDPDDIGHPDAGWRSAVIYTIIQSCRRRGIDPQEYLTAVLGRLPGMKKLEVKDVLPSR